MTTSNSQHPIRVLTWHIHGNYLYYLTHAPVEWYLPVRPDRSGGYGGKSPGFVYGPNVHEVDIKDIKDLDLDVILFQAKDHYLVDQYEILSERQRQLPQVYLEHDPPRENPTNTRHIVDDPEATLVHVTHFNDLMWDSGRTPTAVIDHGVVVPSGVRYTGELERGIVVINNLQGRGRRLGADIFERVRREVPLDLVGINAHELGGVGEVPPPELPAFISRYRFFFNPIRYTSLGLAVCEAMFVGLPIIGMATTEMVTVVENGISGYLNTNVEVLIRQMKMLLRDPELAARLGQGARQLAQQRFNIQRFAVDWERLLRAVVARARYQPVQVKAYAPLSAADKTT